MTMAIMKAEGSVLGVVDEGVAGQGVWLLFRPALPPEAFEEVAAICEESSRSDTYDLPGKCLAIAQRYGCQVEADCRSYGPGPRRRAPSKPAQKQLC